MEVEGGKDMDYKLLGIAQAYTEEKIAEAGGMTSEGVAEIVKGTVGPEVNAYLGEKGITESIEKVTNYMNGTYKTTEDMWTGGFPNWNTGVLEQNSVWITTKDYVDTTVESVRINNSDYVLAVCAYDFEGNYVGNLINGGTEYTFNHDAYKYMVSLRLVSKEAIDTSRFLYCDFYLPKSLNKTISESVIDGQKLPIYKASKAGLDVVREQARSRAFEKYIENDKTLKVSEHTVVKSFDGMRKLKRLVIEGCTLLKQTDGTIRRYCSPLDTESMEFKHLGDGGSIDLVVTRNIYNANNTNADKTFTVNIPLTEPLREVYGVCDELDVLSKTITRKTAEIDLSELIWVLHKTQNSKNVFKGTLTQKAKMLISTEIGNHDNLLNGHICISNCLITRSSVAILSYGGDVGVTISTDGTTVYVSINESKCGSTTEELITYLQSNNAKLCYELAEYTTETLDIDTSEIPTCATKYGFYIDEMRYNKISAYFNTDKEEAIDFYMKERGVEWNGVLSTVGAYTVNQYGTPFQIRGMSTHTLGLVPQVETLEGLMTLRYYGANYIRPAMYLRGNSQYGTLGLGYLDEVLYTDYAEAVGSMENAKTRVKQYIEWAIECDMYVCVDWHGLGNLHPTEYKEYAKDYFAEMTELYKDTPNVIYEIWNEVNGDYTWADVIKPYCIDVLDTIKAINPNAYCIIPTEAADTKLANAIDDEDNLLNYYTNIVYCYHHYHVSYDQDLNKMISRDVPFFMSEWGVGSASTETKDSANYQYSKWTLDMCKKHYIGWAMWALTSSTTSCHNFVDGSEKELTGGWTYNSLSPTGKFIIEHF